MNRFGVLNLLIAVGLIASVSGFDCTNPPERTDIKQCCPYDNLLTKAIVDKCKTYLNDGETPPTGIPGPGSKGPGRGPPPTCYFECALNETGIMKDKEIDEVKLKTYLSTALSGSPDFIPIVQNAFTKCAAKEKEIRASMEKDKRPPPPPDMAGKKMCPPCSAMLMHCVEMETMFNCPASKWKNDDACNNNRDFMKDCKPNHGPHGKPPMP